MGLFSRFKKDRQYKEEELPWHGLPSIYSHLAENIGEDGKLKESALGLPDEERRYADEEIRWAPGALDGAFGHHAGGSDPGEEVKNIVELLKQIARNDSLPAKVALYETLCEDNLLSFIDGLIEELIAAKVPVEPHLHRHLRWLSFEAADRGPVKFGVSLLGLIGDRRDIGKLYTLGLHDEFTLYVAVAIGNSMEDPEATLWKLARALDGWGRIQVVERLTDTENPELKRWLVREGYKNSIMYEYLAYYCAVAGDLLHELQQSEVDDELLDASSDLIHALLMGGPAPDIGSYEDGAEVVALYLEHMQGRANSLKHFLTLVAIRDFLEEEETDWDEMRALGWTLDHRSNLLIDLHPLLSDSRWATLVEQHKDTADDLQFHEVNVAAQELGIDLWETHLKRLHAEPHDSIRWFSLVNGADETRMETILQLVRELIPLHRISSGPDLENGFGPEHTHHRCLDMVLQDLGAYPGKGVDVIEAALKSPVIRNRNLAIRALSEWGEHRWPAGMRQRLEQTLRDEPFEETSDILSQLLAGEEIEF
jgi:hypothetical protein